MLPSSSSRERPRALTFLSEIFRFAVLSEKFQPRDVRADLPFFMIARLFRTSSEPVGWFFQTSSSPLLKADGLLGQPGNRCGPGASSNVRPSVLLDPASPFA